MSPRPDPKALELLKTSFRSDFFSGEASDLEKYGKDWSGVLSPAPSLIAFPWSTEEVSNLLRECSRLMLPVVPSGGRTGLSGGAVAAQGEVVLSLEKMNRIGAPDLGALTLEVEAGAVTEAVHEAVKPFGLTWPVDFASKGSSHVGGNISTNAGGVRVIRYGLTRQWVLGLTVVLMSGEVLKLNGSLEKNNTGIDLRQVFIGSEGTLGVITEAILKLTPLPSEAKTRVVFFAVKDFAAVLELFREARKAPFTLSAFECLSDRCLREVVKSGMKAPFPDAVIDRSSAFVLMEIEAEDADATDAWLSAVLESDLVESSQQSEGVIDAVAAQSPRERAELWALRERVAEIILLGGETHQQDLSVPIANLGDFFNGVEARYAQAYPEFEVFIFGHIGDGNLHFFIRKPAELPSATFHAECAESDVMLFELCQKYSGSVSAEHGIGLLKKTALPYSRTDSEITYAKGLKAVFDPRGLLNPGKIF